MAKHKRAMASYLGNKIQFLKLKKKKGRIGVRSHPPGTGNPRAPSAHPHILGAARGSGRRELHLGSGILRLQHRPGRVSSQSLSRRPTGRPTGSHVTPPPAPSLRGLRFLPDRLRRRRDLPPACTGAPGPRGPEGEGDALTSAGRLRAAAAIGPCGQGVRDGGRGGTTSALSGSLAGSPSRAHACCGGGNRGSLEPSPFRRLKIHTQAPKDSKDSEKRQIWPRGERRRKSRPNSRKCPYPDPSLARFSARSSG